MRLAIILALASMAAIVAGALHIRATRSRDRRESDADQNTASLDDEGQATRKLGPLEQPEGCEPRENTIPSSSSDDPSMPPCESLSADNGTPHSREFQIKDVPPQEENLPDLPKSEGSSIGFSQTPNTSADAQEHPKTGVGEEFGNNVNQLSNQPSSISPDNRDGRPHGPVQSGNLRKELGAARRIGKLEVVCWQMEREWILAVELPEELEANQGISLVQGDKNLLPDESETGCWRLATIKDEIIVRAEAPGSVREMKSVFGNGDHLLFKLSGRDLNRGRCVKTTSSGSYLVIVPENWERSVAHAGPPPVTPEPVCLEGYRAHFFDLADDSGSSIVFLDSTGRFTKIGSSGPRFELKGEKVHDASEQIGSLFCGRTPSIEMTDGSWADIGSIVVGQEGNEGGRWRTSFRPSPALHSQPVSDEINTRKAGRYFVRFYSLENELLDSLDFRFAVGLRGIAIHGSNVPPTETGHSEATVEFQHDADWSVALTSTTHEEIVIERTDLETSLTIPPRQDYDRTQLLFGHGDGPRVDMSILIERIWWALGDENDLPAQWMDRQLLVTREDLRAISNRVLWLHFPKQRWAQSVSVGFSHASSRDYSVLSTADSVAIPLRDFGGVPEMEQIGEFPLRVWVSHHDKSHELSPCRLTTRASCSFCEFSAFTEQEVLQHVRAHHLQELTLTLTWEEHRQRMPGLPTLIYRCVYCPLYVRADNSAHPDAAIIHHIENECRGVVRGPGQNRFLIVRNIEEIRENVIANLPHIHRCRFCPYEFERHGEIDGWEHLVQMHRTRLFDVR